jgi:poly(3-hydroxybutyrate) depolymerase
VFHLHGTADTNHPVDGGAGTGVAGVVFRSARAAVDAIAAANGCAPTPTPVAAPGNPDLTVLTWEACRAGTTAQFVVVSGASHAWMGHPGASDRSESFVGTPYPDLDASRAIWSFLAAQRRR